MDYYHISAEELGQGAKIRLEFPGDSPAVFFEMAQDMVRTIREHNAAGAKTVFICPVGPVGQYCPGPSWPAAAWRQSGRW